MSAPGILQRRISLEAGVSVTLACVQAADAFAPSASVGGLVQFRSCDFGVWGLTLRGLGVWGLGSHLGPSGLDTSGPLGSLNSHHRRTLELVLFVGSYIGPLGFCIWWCFGALY